MNTFAEKNPLGNNKINRESADKQNAIAKNIQHDNRSVLVTQNKWQQSASLSQQVQQLKSIDNRINHSNSSMLAPIQREVLEEKESAVDGRTKDKKIKTSMSGTGWYQYDYDSKGNIDDFSDNKTTSAPKGANPVEGSAVDLEKDVGGGEGEMRSGAEVEILGASRSRHFSIADRIADGTPDDRKGSYTWHHLTPEYFMILVDMEVHKRFGHNGGNSFWT